MMASENDIRVIATPFGQIKNVIHMKSKCQAFLEMDSKDSAKTLLNYYAHIDPYIQNTKVSFFLK